jgi:hypothetical protein
VERVEVLLPVVEEFSGDGNYVTCDDRGHIFSLRGGLGPVRIGSSWPPFINGVRRPASVNGVSLTLSDIGLSLVAV